VIVGTCFTANNKSNFINFIAHHPDLLKGDIDDYSKFLNLVATLG